MSRQQDSFYSHFHPTEHPFVDRLLERLERARYSQRADWTDFLDPRQQFICESLVRREGELHLHFDGGVSTAERKRAWVAPEHEGVSPESAPIALLHVFSLDERLQGLRHGDYLGALLGLGIKREKVGDVHVFDDGCHLLLAAEMADFVALHLRAVQRVHVQVELLPLSELRIARQVLQEQIISVSSLRLDGVVSDVCKYSRAKAQQPIKAGRCRVNWRIQENPGFVLQAGDVVSVQGWGRFKVLDIQGVSKKGNIRVRVGTFSS